MFPVNLALDVYYHPDDSATVAGLLFDDWESDQVAETLLKSIPEVAEYEPGQFYKRELPCLLALIADVKPELETIVIDGYVTLGADLRPGLGTCLYQDLGEEIPIIGVAKSVLIRLPRKRKSCAATARIRCSSLHWEFH